MYHRECVKRPVVSCLSALLIANCVAGGTVHHVDPNGQASAFTSIQAAIDAAESTDEVIVYPGVYRECISFNGKSIRLTSRDGPKRTVIDGEGRHHVVRCVAGEDPNTVLEGFTIAGGNAEGAKCLEHRGAGMLNAGSSPTVRNCIFTGNRARNGAGMYNQDASPTIADCVFSRNGSSGNSRCGRGAGMLNLNSSPTVSRCTFSRNTAGSGGGMYNYRSSPAVTDCTFSRNTAARLGSGMCNVVDSRPTVVRCTFTDNGAMGDEGIFNDIRSLVNKTNGSLRRRAPEGSASPDILAVRTNTPDEHAVPEGDLHGADTRRESGDAS